MRATGRIESIALVVALLAAEGARAAAPRNLSRAERIRYQAAIENVYQTHRIWPSGNRSPRPVLDSPGDRAWIEAKVDDTLAKSAALESLWHHPITAEQLQAEIDRMARDTRDGNVLRELFDALDDDPYVIAETLARQALADRLIRDWYARDPRFHGALRTKLDAALDRCRSASCLAGLGGQRQETTWHHGPADPSARVMPLDDDAWQKTLSKLARSFDAPAARLPLETLSPLEETDDAFVVRSVRRQSAGELTTVSFVWPKRTFDAWWATARGAMESEIPAIRAAYTLPVPSTAACTNDSWTATRLDAPAGTRAHTAVWTGAEMIVWGGFDGVADTNTGGRYNPATDTWTALPASGAPLPRQHHSAVWTGTKMIVWGGRTSAGTPFGDGAALDPASGIWTPTSVTDAASPRSDHEAAWTGTQMIVWGGVGAIGVLGTGGRYDPSTNAWAAMSIGGAPSARSGHTMTWTGSRLVVWGGSDSSGYLDTGARYNPSNDTWIAMPATGPVPSARADHSAVWTGSEVIFWGGASSAGNENTGARFDPVSNTWTSATSISGATPSGRRLHTAVWTGTEMIVWGGVGNTGYLDTGARYDPVSDSWTATAPGPSGRAEQVAVWSGSEMLVWGGLGFSGQVNTGGRYAPSTDSWVPISTGPGVPSERYAHTAVWTGTEMIVWGGYNGTYLATGGRYVAATDSWVPTPLDPGAPTGRYNHTAVWTGSTMIVWGGYNDGYLNTGSRYDPAADQWAPTSMDVNLPPGCQGHSAVWTGTDMIVWGGFNGLYLNSGGRYRPSADAWAPTSTDTGVPMGRLGHVAAWTGARMIVWGGMSNGAYLSDGAQYDPLADTWTATSRGANLPVGRYQSSAVWTGSVMLVWGGLNDGTYLNSGGRYDPVADSWTPTSLGTDCPLARSGHTAIWTGLDMIVWGGSNGSALNSGARYSPPTDSWVAISSGANVPSPRQLHTAIWSGAEMIVWGGSGSGPGNSGGRYCVCAGTGTYYRDADGDGYGNPAVSVTLCTGSHPPGYVSNNKDCDDTQASVYPSAPEINDGLDNQCAGNAGFGMTDEITGNLGFLTSSDKTKLSWGAQPGATGYTLARSPFRDLHAGCKLGSSAVPSLSDAEVPAQGGVFYYLVRAASPWMGSWGQRTSGAERAVCTGCGGSADQCDDANACTAGDTCVGTTCVPGPPPSCDDSNPCTDDACVTKFGCMHASNASPCSDGNPCTFGDTCAAGACVAGALVHCDDGNPCTDDACDGLGGCVFTNNAAPCDDNNACTVGDACAGGTCRAGAALDCNDGNPCNLDACDTALGCTHTANPGACDDGNPCTTDSCDPVNGCSHVNNTAACDDGNPCTSNDVCSGGVCTGTLPPFANHLVISQVQTGGDGATPIDDEFIELYNPTAAPLSLSGLSIQYKEASSGNFLALSLPGVTIPSHRWYLVARSAYNGPAAADLIQNVFHMTATGGHVFLVNGVSQLNGSCPSSASIIDKLGWGNANCPEGTAVNAPLSESSALRKPGGACGNGTDTNVNSADFTSQAPSTPRNSGSAAQPSASDTP